MIEEEPPPRRAKEEFFKKGLEYVVKCLPAEDIIDRFAFELALTRYNSKGSVKLDEKRKRYDYAQYLDTFWRLFQMSLKQQGYPMKNGELQEIRGEFGKFFDIYYDLLPRPKKARKSRGR